jgi:hypothetical protein
MNSTALQFGQIGHATEFLHPTRNQGDPVPGHSSVDALGDIDLADQ